MISKLPTYTAIICFLFFVIKCDSQTNSDISGTFNYLNEELPGDIPKVFGMGTISIDDKNTHASIFSPDGNMLIFSRYPDRKSYIMTFSDNTWKGPTEAFFEGKECSFSADGKRIFYYNNGGDIYYSEKSENGWGEPISVGTNINTAETEYYPSVTYDGTLFFSRAEKWSDGHILYSTLENGHYSPPVDIGLRVNKGGALHAFVAPDKSYMLFNSPRSGSHTQLDIWISFHNSDGSWTEPQNPGETINSGADAILCPTVSPDGKYMFFTKLNFNPQCGFVYWVSTDFINRLKETNLN
jgi:Tol biopolymer transport system component